MGSTSTTLKMGPNLVRDLHEFHPIIESVRGSVKESIGRIFHEII